MAKPPKTPAVIPTQAALAALIGRDEGQVSRYVRRHDWLFGRPPWPKAKLVLIREWLALSVDVVKQSPLIREARVELLQAQLDALNYEHRLLEGRCVLAGDATAKCVRAVVDARDSLIRMPERLYDLPAGDEPGVAAAVATELATILDRYEATTKEIVGTPTAYVVHVDPDRVAGPGGRNRTPRRRGTRPGAQDPHAPSTDSE